MSTFDRLDRMVSRTVDRVNETAFVLTPMKRSPNARPAPDADRDTVEGSGIFDYVEAEYGIELGVRKSYREANDLRALQVGRDPQLSVDRKHFPTLESEPRQGDEIEFPKKPNLPAFEVVSVRRDGLSRLSIQLIHKGSQA